MIGQERFLFGDWPVEVHRRAFRRSISIFLYPQKPIKVVASKTTDPKVIFDFLTKKKEWIEKCFGKFSEFAEKFPEKKIRYAEDFLFMGVPRKLKPVITLHGKTFISITEDHLLLHIPQKDWTARTGVDEHPTALVHIRHFYKREAVRFLSQRIEYWAEQMSVCPKQVRFREQKTRWGSCSSRKNINFNWRLIVFKPEIIDYVIVHEMSHLVHMNHSERFWSLVEKYIPDYREHVKTLRDSQGYVEFLAKKDS